MIDNFDQRLQRLKIVFPDKFIKFNNQMMIEDDHVEDENLEWSIFIKEVEKEMIQCNYCGLAKSMYYFNKEATDDNICEECREAKP